MVMAMHSCLHSTSTAAIWPCPVANTVATSRQLASVVRCAAIRKEEKMQSPEMSRRETMAGIALGTALSRLVPSGMAIAAPGLPPGPASAELYDADCEKELENVAQKNVSTSRTSSEPVVVCMHVTKGTIPRTTTASGLQYKDIVVGSGDSPPVGFQNPIATNYVAMIPNGKVFDSSLEKGVPYIFRVGAEQAIKGFDEGILSMKAGGKRRLYIPGELAFPNGLGAAARGPRGPSRSSPLVFDVCLIYIPGIFNL